MKKSTLTLRRAIWNKDLRRSTLNQALSLVATELEGELKDNIDNSTPAGRMYKRNKPGMGPGRGRRLLIQPQVFTSSVQEQPPARRFSTLYNSIVAKRVPGKMSIMASVNAPGVRILDDPARLNRPFFRTIIIAYRREQFTARVRSAVRELLK